MTESAVHIPGQNFYLLQYGVFSTPERAAQAIGELQQSGIAAGGDLDEENRVYAGISPDREQAKLLSNQLKAEGVELYVREIALPGIESAAFAGEEQTLTDYFTISGQLVSELSQLSASLLGMQEPGAATAEHMNTVTNLHQQWIQSVKQLAEGLGPRPGRAAGHGAVDEQFDHCALRIQQKSIQGAFVGDSNRHDELCHGPKETPGWPINSNLRQIRLGTGNSSPCRISVCIAYRFTV